MAKVIIKIRFIFLLYLCTGNRLLDEVVLHVTLEVEVGELVRAGESEELGKARVGVNLAPVLLVLEALLANVGVNLLAHLSAGHLGSNGLSEELGELVADAGGLDEPGRLPVSSGLPLLRVLLGALELTRKGLLEGLVIALHGREEAGHLLELCSELLYLNGSERGLDDRLRNNGGGRWGVRGGDRDRFLLHNNIFDNSGGGSGGGLRRSNHF